MNSEGMTPARKRQFVIAGLLMLGVIVLAAVVAANGERIYMHSQGYFETCSPLPHGMACQYCKCPDGSAGSPGFGGASCASGAKPVCMSR